MTTEQTTKALNRLNDNIDFLRDLMQEINAYDGSFDSLEVHEFDDDFFNTYFEGKPMEAVQRAFFGEISNWSDEYIRFNGYGNLESVSDYAYNEELLENRDELIARAVELADQINLTDIIERYE